jgi:tetratricopeptide (TPR) repeat protein
MLFIGILSFRYLKLKQFIFINLFAIATLIISGIIVKDSFLTTVKFNTTISQQRSTEGRTTLWKHSLKQFKEKPIFGFGQDNYIISNEKEPLISEDVIFNNRTNNTFIQLLIERGIFGIFCYFLFFIFVIKIIWKGLKSKSTTNKDKLQILIVASGLLAFLLREFTFSSFFENDFVNIVAFHLVFLLIPFDIDLKQITITKIRKKTIAYFGLTLFIIIGLLNIKKLLVTNYNKTFVRSYNSDEKDLQVEELDKALFLNSNNLTLIRHKALAFAKNSISIDISSNNMNLLDMKISNVDSLKLFKNQFLEILENKPNDHETFHNLGWLFMAEKDYSEAENYFENAIGINPYIVEYQCSLVLCKIAQSKLEEITDPLSKALQYSPDLLESIFYLELEKKYSSIAKTAKSDAIFNIQEKLKRNGNNPIFKARLARLILNEDKQNTYKLLNSVNETLPNLNRPWLYKGYLKSLELDTVSANMFFKKAKFLNSGDYLNFLYEGNYHRKFKNDSMAVENYERMIEIYKSLTSSSYINNAAWSRISTIRNSNIPEELLYYINPKFDTDRILNYMEEYYRKNDNDEKATQFKELKQRFQGKLFMGEID